MSRIFDNSMPCRTTPNLREEGFMLDGEVLTRVGIVQAKSDYRGTFLRYCAHGRLFTRHIKHHYLTKQGLARVAAKFAKEKSRKPTRPTAK